MKGLKEAQYDQIFSPETMSVLKGKSGESLRQMIGDRNLMSTLSRTMQLLPQIEQAESEYIDELEMLAVQMVKDAYPIIDYAGIEIDAKIATMDEVTALLDKEEEEEEKPTVKSIEFIQNNPLEDIPDDKKRRIINGITQGASIRGAFWFLIFREYLDVLDPSLVEKYKEIMNLTLGVYDDENAIALLLAMLAQNQKLAGGVSMIEVERPLDDEDDEQGFGENEEPTLKIIARAINFPMLVYEIVKGLYEIVSLQGFGADKEKNKQVVKRIDKLENEPDDLRFGKFIYDAISNLYNQSQSDDPRVRELLFTEVYKLPDNEFFPFIENAIHNRLTSKQKQWINNSIKEIESDLRKDDTGLDGLD